MEKIEQLTKELLGMDCFYETSTYDMNAKGCEVSVYDAINFIRKINSEQLHTVRGHSVVYDLCSIDYERSDYIGIDYDNSLFIDGNTIKINNAEKIKIFISPNHWYDVYIFNKNGYVTLCFSPK